MRSENHSRTWNIFETIETFGLLCAVPVEMPLPDFLISSDWRYQRQSSDRVLPFHADDDSEARLSTAGAAIMTSVPT